MNKVSIISFCFALLLLLLISFVLPQLVSPAELRISLKHKNLAQGQEQILFYKITNIKEEPLKNVNLIINLNGNKEEFYLGDIIDVYRGTFKINDTNNLKGRQEITTILEYEYKEKHRGTGELKLTFEVY